MRIAYLLYEQKDAALNHAFITQLQQAARTQKIDLQLKILEHFEPIAEQPLFVWNRTRNHEIAAQFEARGIRVFNNSKTNKLANDKLLAQHHVKSLDIPAIESFTERPQTLDFPFIVKSVDGHGGKEVFLCEDEAQHDVAIGQLQTVIYQPYIESNSTDVRLWMLGEDVLAAVKRSGQNSFKSNYTLGGTIEIFDVPKELAQSARRIADSLQSNYIGIDFILGADGQFYFNELEDPVGARSYYALYDGDLPGILMGYICRCLGDVLRDAK
ncbi:MAG: ATP-grasp domain-containing protein [Solibacillus sp.]